MGAMGTSATLIPGLEIPPPMAISVVLAFVAAGLYLVRAHQRRARRNERRRIRALARHFVLHIDGRYGAADLRREVAACTEGEFWSTLERLSMRMRRREWIRLSGTLERNPFSAAERRALRDDSAWRRALAARRLSLLASRTSRRALRRGMGRGPEMVTFACAQTLARYGDLAALRWMLEHPARIGRRPFVPLVDLFRAFGKRGGPVLAAALDQGLDHPRVERAAIEALGLLREVDARPALERRLAGASIDLRATAARALGRLESVESGTSLLHALRDEAWQVRAQAAKALGLARIPIAVPALGERLTDPSWWVRHHAAYALHRLGYEGQQRLRSIAESSPDPYARDMAREVLDGGPRFAA
jgi:hypothetical protein